MSALPKAVQAQLDQAEALQAQLAEASAPEQVEGNPEAQQTSAQPDLQLVNTQAEPTQVTQSIPEETWEQRFKIMEGKFKAEVPRLHEQNRELAERLEKALAALEEKAKEPPPEQKKLVTDADVDAFGSDLVDMVRRAAREEFDSLARVFATEMDKRYGAVAAKADRAEQVVAKTASDKFWDSVVGAHKDFDAINQDPRWFQYLDQRPKGSKLTNRQSAEAAIGDLDAQTLIDLVDLFKQSLGIAQTQTPAKPKPNLNAQVAPSSSRASAPAEPNTGKIWSGAEYAAALDHRNMQRMTRAEYDALVADAEAAFAEGRVKF